MFSIEHLTKSFLTKKGRQYIFRDVSAVFPPEKNIALIGKNGSGKSTLMRLLSGIDTPDSGRVVTDKAISWPVGLSGGFQGSLTGRDNVKFVCRTYGAVGETMGEKIDYVQRFAEIGKWFDEPVKTYSSGMRSRLAFGLSMAFKFDYYLIDEVMSVGDAQFREKCREIFHERLEASKIILTTHSMGDVEKFCDVVVLLQAGKLIFFDDVKAGIHAYRT